MIKIKLNHLRQLLANLLFGPMNEYRGLKLEIKSLSNELHDLEDKKTASFHALAQVTEQFVRMNQKYGYSSKVRRTPVQSKPIVVDSSLLRVVTKLKGFRMN